MPLRGFILVSAIGVACHSQEVSSNIRVHDPVMIKEGSTFYLFSAAAEKKARIRLWLVARKKFEVPTWIKKESEWIREEEQSC